MNMRYLFQLCVIAFILSAGTLRAQVFNPNEWIGKYAGTMNLSSGKNTQTVAVEFDFVEVKKDSIWTYTLIYKVVGKDPLTKDYRIKRITDNTFVLDEQDGVLIDLPFRNGAFLSIFEVEGMVHSSSMSLTDKGIRLELFGAMIDKPSRSTQTNEKENPLKVNSYAPSYAQTVLLKRRK